ncbi:phage terminase small subunit P27 family [Methylocystis parvus]|uniref:phage terminase small subunit P27 family n=1 Tax=Methylocystis parvus TaxID=134 RepID=UPI003C733EC5
MGRRKDSPETQALKGSPGKRMTKAERQAAEATAIAELLAATPAESGGALSPPAFLADPRCAAALSVWRDYAPKLSRLNILGELDRFTFSLFCVYAGEFVTAQQDILKNGYAVTVKTYGGEGAARPFINPSVKRRDTAFAIVAKMAENFGLTPADRLKLLQSQAANPLGGLFGGAPSAGQAPTAPEAPAAPEADDEIIGAAGRFDSPPPGRFQ